MWGRGHRGPGTQTACLQHSAPCNQGLSCSPWDWRVVEMPPAHPASPGPVRNNPRRHFSGPGCSSLAKGEWPVPHRTSPCLFAEPWEPVELSEQFLLRGHSWPGCLWPLPWAPGSSWWKPRCLASAPPCPCAWPGLGWELQRREGEELSVSPALRGFTSVGPAAQGAASWTPCLQLSTLRQPSALCGSPTSASGAFASPL